MEKWPNLFIVGAPKAGTTSLYNYFKQIPGIYMSPIKEPNYFSKKTIPENHTLKPIRDKKKYLDLFSGSKEEKFFGEASPQYLADPDTPKLIHHVSPYAYIIISIRNPIERLYSSYLMAMRGGQLKTTFHDVIQHALTHKIYKCESGYMIRLNSGLYSKHIKNYLDIFGKKQIKILIFEKWNIEVKKTLNEITEFLKLNYTVTENFHSTYNPYVVPREQIPQGIFSNNVVRKISRNVMGESTRKFFGSFFFKEGKKPEINAEDRKKLAKFYFDDVREIEKLLGCKLPWSDFNILDKNL